MDRIAKKRKLDDDADGGPSKRLKPAQGTQETPSEPKGKQKSPTKAAKPPKRQKVRKLVPARPFPVVPPSVSATGPRSSHREGKNKICLTRKTPLGAYLRRCKDVIVKDGYKTLYLSAMGAAIPHLLRLVAALPTVLPHPPDQIHQEITTGTVEVHDEVLPEDDEDDIDLRTRSKSTLLVVFRLGDGLFEGDTTASRRYAGGKELPLKKGKRAERQGQKARAKNDDIIFEEPEQDLMDTL